jgi:beta-glucosidase
MGYSYGASAEVDNNSTGIPAAVAVASAADVIVLVVGDTKATCGEMVDRSSLELPGTIY